jgi:hypothetical protein
MQLVLDEAFCRFITLISLPSGWCNCGRVRSNPISVLRSGLIFSTFGSFRYPLLYDDWNNLKNSVPSRTGSGRFWTLSDLV